MTVSTFILLVRRQIGKTELIWIKDLVDADQ